MSETVESLVVDLGADDDDLESTFEAAQKSIQDFADNLNEVGESMSTYISAPLAAFGGLAGVIANDFDASQGKMQAQLGITADEAENLGNVAEEVWKDNFGENIEDVTDGIAKVKQYMGDIPMDELKSVTESAYILSDAFGADIGDSIKTAAQLMKNFKIDGQQAMDIITVGFQKGGDYSGELLDTLNEYAPQFASMGLSAQNMLGLLIQGAQDGAFNLDKVGDAVKEFNIRAQDGSKTTKQGFEMIGLNAGKMGEAIASGGEDGANAFKATVTALAAMKDPMQQNIAGTALFGTQWEDLRSKVVSSMSKGVESINKVNGATKAAGDALYDNLGSQAQTVWREMQDAMEPIGEILIDLAEKAVPPVSNAISDLSKWFTKLGPSMQQSIVIFGILAAAIGPILMITGALISAIGSIGLVAAGIIAGVLALAAVFIVLWKNSEVFRDVVIAVFNKVKDIALSVFGIVRDFIMQKVAEIQKFWAENGAQIMEAASNVFNFIKSIVSFVMPFVLMLIQSIWGNIKGVISGALDIIMGLIKIFAGLFTGDWSKMWEGIKQLLGGALQFLWNLFSLMMIGKLLGGIKAFITGGLGFFKSFGSAVVGTFKEFFNNVISWFQYFRLTGSSIWQAAVSVFKNLITMFVQSAKTNFTNVLNTAKSVFNGVKDAILHPIKTAKDTVKGFIEEIKGFFSGLKLKLPDIKMPHFKIKNWSKNPIDWIKAVPSLDIDWYAKGGVFDGASVIGVGERGPEAVVPLQGHRMKPFAEEVANQMPGGSGKQTLEITINNQTNLDSRVIGQGVYKVVTEMQDFDNARKTVFAGR